MNIVLPQKVIMMTETRSEHATKMNKYELRDYLKRHINIDIIHVYSGLGEKNFKDTICIEIGDYISHTDFKRIWDFFGLNCPFSISSSHGMFGDDRLYIKFFVDEWKNQEWDNEGL